MAGLATKLLLPFLFFSHHKIDKHKSQAYPSRIRIVWWISLWVDCQGQIEFYNYSTLTLCSTASVCTEIIRAPRIFLNKQRLCFRPNTDYNQSDSEPQIGLIRAVGRWLKRCDSDAI